ncbi:MAG: hypothetical protein ACNI27_13195 [Desulfovibrio sp.]
MHTIFIDFHGKIGRLGDVSPFLQPYIQSGELFPLFKEKLESIPFDVESTHKKVSQHLTRNKIEKFQCVIVLNMSEDIISRNIVQNIIRGSLSFQMRYCYESLIHPLKNMYQGLDKVFFIAVDSLERDKVTQRPLDKVQSSQWDIDTMGILDLDNSNDQTLCHGVLTTAFLNDIDKMHDKTFEDINLTKERINVGIPGLSKKAQDSLNAYIHDLRHKIHNTVIECHADIPDEYTQAKLVNKVNYQKALEYFDLRLKEITDSEIGLLKKIPPSHLLKQALKRAYSVAEILEEESGIYIRVAQDHNAERTTHMLQFNIGILLTLLIHQEEKMGDKFLSGMMCKLLTPIAFDEDKLALIISQYHHKLAQSLKNLEQINNQEDVNITEYAAIGAVELNIPIKFPESSSIRTAADWKSHSDTMLRWEELYKPKLQEKLNSLVKERPQNALSRTESKSGIESFYKEAKLQYSEALENTVAAPKFSQHWETMDTKDIRERIGKIGSFFPRGLFASVLLAVVAFATMTFVFFNSQQLMFLNDIDQFAKQLHGFLPISTLGLSERSQRLVTSSILSISLIITSFWASLLLRHLKYQTLQTSIRALTNQYRQGIEHNIWLTKQAIQSSLDYSFAWKNLQSAKVAQNKYTQKKSYLAYHIDQHKTMLTLCERYLLDLGHHDPMDLNRDEDDYQKVYQGLIFNQPKEKNALYIPNGTGTKMPPFTMRLGSSHVKLEHKHFPLLSVDLPKEDIYERFRRSQKRAPRFKDTDLARNTPPRADSVFTAQECQGELPPTENEAKAIEGES